MEHSQQQRLAYMLAVELQKATGKFARRCPAINLANFLGFSLSDIANLNVDKIDSRIDRGTLHGSDDNR